MQTKLKKSISILLSLLMTLSVFGGTTLFATAEETYAVGDIIEFGGYPQSQVTDSVIVSQLDALSQDAEWVSYGYYSGDGNEGSMQPGNWMKYCDVELNDSVYRGVRFTIYRPNITYSSNTGSSTSTYQDDNGYYTNTTYWFKWESLVWRVLDPGAGHVLCENIIDSQAYSNTIYKINSKYYNEPAGSVYANDYESSSIRQWLINDFYNTAFSASEQEHIAFTPLDNSAISTSYSHYDSNPTNDKIFLLSYDEVQNSSYGFSSSSSRQASGTDYAKCQGLYEYSGNKNTDWRLRSAGIDSRNACTVNNNGYVEYYYRVYGAYYGIRPAFKFQSGIIQSSNPNGGSAPTATACKHAGVQVVDPVPATCTTDGNTGYTICLDCGEIISGENTVIPATGHAYVNHEAKAPTCTEIGWDAYRTCENCDYTEYVELPANGHAYVNHDAKAPTCTEIGWDAYRTCENCDYTEYVEIPANGHAYVNHDAQTPTCTEIGWEAYRTCENCDYTEYVEIPASGHTYVNHDPQAPTCTEIGWAAYRTCENCDYTEYVELPATGHAYVNHEAKAPTCTEIGWDAYRTCENCDYTEYVEIPANGHAYVNHDAQTPTCTEIGWEAYRTCENCDYTEYVELPANGHAYVNHDAQAPTCTEIGWAAYRTCENCDYTEYVEIPANGHVYVNHDAQAPTCTEIGWEAYRTCENCDYSEYVEIPANGHAYVNHDAQAPTCTEIGWDAYRTCENCDYTEFVEIPAAGHDYRFDSFVWAEDCTTAQAKLVCANDASHITLADVTVTSETTAPTATEDGFTVYTATYEGRSEEKTVVDEGSATGEVTPPDDPSTPTDGEKIHGEHCFCYNVSEDSSFGSLLHFLCGLMCALLKLFSAVGVTC